MSEYQYYEFLAVDRPLGEDDRQALRRLSSRARITATSFTNHYEWGDFKGSPRELMQRWFDLHLYVTNWGTRQLMIRLPKSLVDRDQLDACLVGTDTAEVVEIGDNLILDICTADEDGSDHHWDDGSGWLAALAPLRMELLSGDWRLPYLLWLMGVENGSFLDEALEPLPGIAPLSGGLVAFAEFFRIDRDLLKAAAERRHGTFSQERQAARTHTAIATLPDTQKTALLLRLAEGDPHVAAELRRRVRSTLAQEPQESPTLRSAGALRERAEAIRNDREAAARARRRTERKRQEELAEKARRARLAALRRRGADVWREVEAEVERRNASGYDRAASLIFDLHAISNEDGSGADFANRLNALCKRHERKQRFIERLHGVTYAPALAPARRTPAAGEAGDGSEAVAGSSATAKGGCVARD